MTTSDTCRIIDVLVEEDDEISPQITEVPDEVDEPSCVAVVAPIPRSPPLPTLNRNKLNNNNNSNNMIDMMPIKPLRNVEDQWINSSDEVILPTLAKSDSSLKIIEPSPDALVSEEDLHPCPTCGRKFVQKTYDKHIKICEKVSTKKRKVFDGAKKRLEGLPDVPHRKDSSDNSAKKKPAKPEDEFQKCPHCTRNFGPKAYDRHVTWCEEKSRRMQDSPNKDMVALAKLHARVAYRPKTPNRKESTGSGSGSLKNSFTSSLGETPVSSSLMTSTDGSDLWTQSLNREVTRKGSVPSGTRSLGRSGGISFLDTVDHTKETTDTKFLRAATGRGSIKRGPAPTKASVLRQQKALPVEEKARSKTPSVPRRITSPVVTSPRKAASPGFHLQSNNHANNNNNQYSYLIKPSAVRPGTKPSVGLRREPEGIEDVVESKDRLARVEPLLSVGQYDHSREYDPYQSAARQMQELLFGTTASSSTPPPRQQAAGAPSTANLRPSTNSAFQRYVPSPNVPSTADINSKFLSARAKLESYMTLPRRTSGDSMRSSWDGGVTPRSLNGTNNNNNTKSWSEAYTTPTQARNNAKVAKFCHECGNPFALPDIRFCCECGVKRLYC